MWRQRSVRWTASSQNQDATDSDGKEWRSLTAIARAVKGYPAISIGGPAWFGIEEPETGAPKRGAPRDAGTAATATD